MDCGRRRGGASAVTLHAPDTLGPIPAYSIVCLDGTDTDGVPNLKLATGVTAGVDLYVTQETVTGADVQCMYAIGSICTVRFEGTDANVGDPISVSLSTAGVGCASKAYPTVGVAVMPSSNGTVQVQLTGGCLNVEKLTVEEQVLAGDVVTVVNAKAKKSVLGTKMPYGVTVHNNIAADSEGLFAVKAGDVCNVKCTSEEVVTGDWLVPSESSAGYARSGSGYGIGKAMESKAAGSIGFVKCRLSGGHYGVSTRLWYLVDEIDESNVVAAYKFKGAATVQEALTNVNEGTAYALTKTDGVTLATGKGLLFPASTDCYINNEGLIAQASNITTCVFQYSDLSVAGVAVTAGACIFSNCKALFARYCTNRRASESIYEWSYHTLLRNASSYPALRTAKAYESGCLAADWNYNKMWHDGIQQSLTTGDYTNVSGWGLGRVFTTCSFTHKSVTASPMYVTALVFYNCSLTDAQHVQLANQINAL